MTSPTVDVVTRRRYHRHRKTKKKASLSKEALGKGIPPPKFSKRLTSGFGFRGAVFTTSHSRNSKGDGVIKPRKSSTDYDLQCLLKAAKSKVISDPSQSPSSVLSSAEDIDDPFNSVEHYSEEDQQCVNYKQKPPQQPASMKEMYVDAGTSSGNRVPFGSEEQDSKYSEESMQVNKVPMNKQDNSDHMCKGNHNFSSAKDHNINQSNSSENSTTYAKPKPHISSYQKFAVGIVEALVLEKKKEFPNLDLSKQIKLELNDIHQRSKIAADMKKKATNTYFQMPQCNTLELCESESKVQGAPQPSDQLNPVVPSNKYATEEKSFKERTVEAWVEAIPQDLTVYNEEPHKYHKTKTKSSDVDFQRDFLKNVKKEQTKSAPRTSAKESSLWITNEAKSPVYSPFLAKEKKAVPALKLLPPCNNESQEPNRGKCNSKNLNFHIPWEKGRGYENSPRVQQSWTSWFKGKIGIGEQRQPDSPFYPSPHFAFDPPCSKRSWFAMKEDFGTNTFTDTKHPANDIEDKLSVWSQFPKLVKRDERGVAKLKGGQHGQQENKSTYNQNKFNFQEYNKPIEYERSVTDQIPESSVYIRFAPRKMF